jgi:hypothetical protein
MYIRKSMRSYKGRTYTNYVLVESVQTSKGPRQKSVCSLGDLSPRPREEWLSLTRKIEDALLGQERLVDQGDAEVAAIVHQVRERRENTARASAELITVDPTRVTTEQHREAGPIHVGYHFWQRLSLDRIVHDCGLPETVRQLACAMVLNRLIAPASEHAMPDWMRLTALVDILDVAFEGVDDNRLYRVLDNLYPHRATIEAALVQRERSLFNLDTTIYLYDLTSTYFEGQSTPGLRKVPPLSWIAAWPMTRTLLSSKSASCTMWSPAGSRSAIAGWPILKTPRGLPIMPSTTGLCSTGLPLGTDAMLGGR